MSIGKLLRRVYYGADTRLRRLEQSCVDALLEAAGGFGDALRLQTSAIDLVKREMGGKLVQIALDRRILPSARVLDVSHDLLAATIELSPNGRADILFSGGLLSAIEFDQVYVDQDRSVGPLHWITDINRAERPKGSEAERDAAATILGEGTLEDFLAPADARFRDAFVSRLNRALPPDFLSLLEVTDGLRFGPLSFEGTQSRTIPWPDRTLQSLAETLDGRWAVCVDDSEETDGLLILDQASGSLEPADELLVPAMNTLALLAQGTNQ